LNLWVVEVIGVLDISIESDPIEYAPNHYHHLVTCCTNNTHG
jgi:hypothetical protein